MRTRLLFALLTATLISAASVDAGAQAVNVSRMGILTSGYTWAYGSWHVVESVPDGGTDDNDFYISIDKYQIRMKNKSLSDVPLCVVPETNYANNDMDADMFGVGPDEVLIEFVGRYGEDTYLMLDRKSKTISHFSAEDRADRGIKVTTEKCDPGTAPAGYFDTLTSSPVIGSWVNVDDPEDTKTFTAENLRNEFIPAAGGLEHYLWAFIYSVDPESGLLTARNVFDKDGLRTRTYKRQDE